MLEIRKVNFKDLIFLQTIKPDLSNQGFQNRLDQQKQKKILFLIMFSDNEPVCLTVLSFIGKATHPEYPDLSDLYTKESRRGEGFGKQMILECERLAKELGFQKIGLAVNQLENPIAKIVYEKFGYKSLGEPAYVDGVYNGIEDWVIDLEKDL